MGGASMTAEPNSTNSTLPLPLQQDENENVKAEEVDNEEDEKGECGFCAFMKAGPCGEKFAAWEQCIKDSEKNKAYAAQMCVDVFKTLRDCMEENQDHYDFLLKAEKAELNKEDKSKSESSEQE